MIGTRAVFLRLAVVVACWATVSGADAVKLRTPEFMAKVKIGFDQVYNLDYRESVETFERMLEQFPDHPAPPLYLATAIWLHELYERRELELDHFIAPSYFDKPTERRMPIQQRQRFTDLIEESQRKSNAILAGHPGNKDARYFLGSSYGVLASFAITIDRSRGDAFKNGKKAYGIHHEIVEEDANYYDAYMSVGVYEYIVGNLPWYIKWLAAIVGYRGSVDRGFEYLSLASNKGQFVADDARTLQLVLFVREKRYEDALELVRHLENRAPKNFIFQLNKAHILEKMGQKAKATEVYEKTLARAEQGVPNFDRLPLEVMRCRIGRKLLLLGRPEPALKQFRLSLADGVTPEPERTLSQLFKGQALDLLGRREEALASYRAVLELPEVDMSHRQAKRFIEKPFSAP